MAIHVQHNDAGTRIQLTFLDALTGLPKDISTATVKQIKLRGPYGATHTLTAEFVVTGSDGEVEATVPAGVFAPTGGWKAQGYVETPAGAWHTRWGPFEVEKNIADY